MAGAKETPRQKMIGMMYLVLTALLALNVSKSILDSFVRVNESLETTNSNFIKKNNKLYSDFQETYNADKQKVRPYWNKAQQVQNKADSLYYHVDSMKTYLKAEVDGLPWEKADTIPLEDIQGKSNYDVPSQKMGLASPSTPKGKEWGKYTALELKKKIQGFRGFLYKTLEEETNLDTSTINLNLETKGDPEAHDPAAQSWEGLTFYHAPLAAAITALTKVQSDIRNAESDVVSALLNQVGAEDFSFDTLAPKVIPLNGSYIAVGDTYKAEVIVAAWNTTRDPKLELGRELDTAGNLTGPADTASQSIKNGLGYYEFVPQSQGQIEWGGKISIQGPSGNYQDFKVEPQSVRAAEQNVVVSPTKMNVLYRGLDNPISVSVPGMAAEDLQASMSNGSIAQKGAGAYTARPGNAGNESVVTVADKDGKRLGDMRFRVKDVPRPQPFFAGNTTTDNYVTKNRLQVAEKVEARLEDFLFEGVSFDVVEFEIGATVGGQFPTEGQQGGNSLSSRQRELLKNVQQGGRVEVRNIVALDPSGKRRNLSSLSFEIQ